MAGVSRARGVTVPATGENGRMHESTAVTATVERRRDRWRCWPTGADVPLSPGVAGLPARPRPADGGAPGPPPSRRRRAGGGRAGARHRPPAARGSDETHADDAARRRARALGERVAGIVGLHVEAKRYLVATEAGYGGVLTNDSVVSLGRQGGALTRARTRGLPGAAVGGRRRDAAPGRRQREGRGPGGARPRQLGTPSCRPSAGEAGRAGRLSGPRPTVGYCRRHHRAAGPGRTLCGG